MTDPIDITMMRDYNEMMSLLDDMGIPHIPYEDFKEIWQEEMLESASGTKH